MVQNYHSDCQDDDFFDIIRNCFDHDKAVELIEAAYSPKELEEMQHAKLMKWMVSSRAATTPTQAGR